MTLDLHHRGLTTQNTVPSALRPVEFVFVSARVAARAASAPDEVAVVDVGTELTYRELDEQAGRWAATLRASGVGPGSCVAVLLPRPARYIVATRAVMKSGAASPPLAPATPANRVAFI